MTEINPITHLKKTLCNSIENENFDLLSEEVITISQELDQQLLPLFKQQLDVYNIYLQIKKPV
ncbi:Spo0E family sporulation regulatory protein-aspartic acid phosphatase [Candidatus Epulonipiscium viviparus]|uniref:Spo0E family sporulation regulatory protein-aspartic acid phosphatase n=1 Tax=Candidatus Epulonipiscium viviparus TaxID=420336 RepID=UPI00016BFDB3|nr:Spo0E family sporulation regulatory protein-aspartic acid phosphatase [Candidatus Epulopiscium viviparus]